MDLDAVRRDWSRRGYSCDVWTDPPGQVWRDYVHASDELLMLIEGAIEIHLDGQILHPTVGEEVSIPARTSHTVINPGSQRNSWLYGYRSQ